MSLISNKYSLCQILAVLPASSIDCERGFSNLNRIKRDDRNRVDGDQKCHLPVLVKLWKAEKERRLDGRADLNLPET